MPAPANTTELLDLIRKSGVVDEAKLQAYVQKLTGSSGAPTDPAKLASQLVSDGILTYFQAEQLLQGKYKRFTIGKYKVLEKLGAGGMAQVFLCEHKLMRRRVAIKVLPTAKASDPSSLERFYREARAVAAVDHPNIVRAYDIDQDENLHFLVMEYVDGTNLQDLVKKFGPLDVIRACHYVYGSAVGLQHAHEMGLIHRDVKPGNILIDRAGVVKILDLGLARFFHDDDDVLTKKYDENVLGTADYLAPEQALDSHTVDIRADVYSLGATFYFLLTASALFPEGSVAQKLIWHQNRLPRPIRSIRPEVPEEVVAIVDRMMAKDPANRYQTPAEVMAALANWVTTPIAPPSDREMPRVSPAAGGSRGPASMVGAAPGVFARVGGSGRPQGGQNGGHDVAPVPLTPAQPIPYPSGAAAYPAQSTVPQSEPANPGVTANPAVWESLDSDTQTVAQGNTDRPVPQPEPSSWIRKQTGPKTPSSRRVVLLASLAILLAGAIVGVYFAFFNKTSPPPDGSIANRKITVSKAGGEHTVATLREALSRASAGDTIVIAESKLSEPSLKLDKIKHKDLTIESATPDGKPAIVEFSGRGTEAVMLVMLDANEVEGFHIKNVEFDGKGIASVGIQITGVCPSVTIENVTVRGAKSAAFKFNSAGLAGKPGRPILLDRVRVQLVPPATPPPPTTPPTPVQDSIGVWFTTSPEVATDRVVIRNSRFEGPGKIAIKIDGGANELEITGNRFFAVDKGLVLGVLAAGKSVKGQFTSNTIYQTTVGISFDFGAPDHKGKYELAVNQNYFTKTALLANAATTFTLTPTPTDNASGPEVGGSGNVSLNATPLLTPILATPNPADDATFLRFTSGPPELPNKVKVGAP